MSCTQKIISPQGDEDILQERVNTCLLKKGITKLKKRQTYLFSYATAITRVPFTLARRLLQFSLTQPCKAAPAGTATNIYGSETL